MKILIAEDETVTRSMLKRKLSNWGYELVLASSGSEAWEKLQREDAPKLIILDWMMPGMSGVEICRRIRRLETSIPPYIILLTSCDNKTDIIEGFDAGADD